MRPTRALPALAAPVLLILALLAPAGPASAAEAADAGPSGSEGWLRLAHLSPDTPQVDVYLSSFAGSGAPVVLKSVGYGDVSGYRAVPAGTYTATMRPAGAASDSPAVISATARIGGGKAYTVAAVGLRADISGRVLQDDLTPPAQGQGRVRVISAATRAASVDVQAVGGPKVADGLGFGKAGDYSEVPAGRWNVTVTPVDGTAGALTTSVDVPAGRVASLLVLDDRDSDGALTVVPTLDSEGAASTPTGGVATGAGPSQPSSGSGSDRGTLTLLALAGLAGGLLLRPRRLQRVRT